MDRVTLIAAAERLSVALLLVSTVARGATPLEVVELDLVVPAAARTGHRQAAVPIHRLFTGDEARIVATIRLGTLRLVRPRVTFSTNAPLKGRRDEPRSEGVFVGPAGPRLFAGSAVFTTAGTYKLRVHVDHEGGPQEADATFTIEVATAPAEKPASPEPPASGPVSERPPTSAQPAAGAPPRTVTPTAVPESRVSGPDAAMIRRLRIAIGQAAKTRACTECPALLMRAEALGGENDAAAALAEYQALLGELSRIQK